MGYDVVVTGHQPEKLGLVKDDPDNMRRLAPLIPIVKRAIMECIDDEPARFWIGMAQGFDLVAGGAIMQLKNEGRPLEIVCVYPYPNFGRYWVDQLARAWQKKIHAAAFDAYNKCEHSPKNAQEAKMLLDERNTHLVTEVVKGGDSSPRMLSCWSGRSSGTGRTQAKFEKASEPEFVVNVWEEVALALGIDPDRHLGVR